MTSGFFRAAWACGVLAMSGALGALSACAVPGDPTGQADAAALPNVVFILVDDLGYGDVGFNGSTWYETPRLDALAAESLVFDNAYMYPTCSPSRAALLTGRQSFRTGVYTVPVLEAGTDQENIFSRWTVLPEHRVYAQPMQAAGYRGIHLGKWHIVGPYPDEELAMDFPLDKKLTQPDPGDYSWVARHRSDAIQQYYPRGRGFIENVGGTFRGDPAFEEGGYQSDTGGYRAPFSNPFIDAKPGDEWLTDRLTDDAIDFMKRHRGEPFLVNLHTYTVHRPIKSRSDALLAKYLAKPGDPVTGQGEGKRREEMAGYATMLESLDTNVGRIVDFLDASGLRENTVIVVTSDNGYNRGQSANHGLRGAKGDIYEGGIRVPWLVNWPGRVAPRRSGVAVSGLDLFPTFTELAGVTGDLEPLDGNSIVPLFAGDTAAFVERPLFWHLASQYKHGTCSVIRKGHHKLIQFLADGRVELYDLEADPKEQDNLAGKRPRLEAELVGELVAWRRANHVPLPPNAVMAD